MRTQSLPEANRRSSRSGGMLPAGSCPALIHFLRALLSSCAPRSPIRCPWVPHPHLRSWLQPVWCIVHKSHLFPHIAAFTTQTSSRVARLIYFLFSKQPFTLLFPPGSFSPVWLPKINKSNFLILFLNIHDN